MQNPRLIAATLLLVLTGCGTTVGTSSATPPPATQTVQAGATGATPAAPTPSGAAPTSPSTATAGTGSTGQAAVSRSAAESRITTRPASIPASARRAEVVRVVDGDTLDVRLDGREDRVLLIGVDTPEVHGQVDPYGPEASAFTKQVLPPGTRVWLEQDVETRGRYGRLLAYAWLADGRLFNEVLLREGYAQLLTIPPNVRYVERFQAAQAEAREAGRGLWSPSHRGPGAAAADSPSTSATTAHGGGTTGLRYKPNGPNRDCEDFATQVARMPRRSRPAALPPDTVPPAGGTKKPPCVPI